LGCYHDPNAPILRVTHTRVLTGSEMIARVIVLGAECDKNKV